MNGISFVAYDDIKDLDCFPSYKECKVSSLHTPLFSIERLHSYIIFVSHRWLRSWLGSEGFNEQSHPDNENNDKFSVLLEAVHRIQTTLLVEGGLNVFLWIDYCCLDPVDGITIIEECLVDIMKCSDCMLTPIAESAVLIESKSSSIDWYYHYQSPSWNSPIYGYTSRAWCRTEILYAANIPLEMDFRKIGRLKGSLKHFATLKCRPHLICSKREISLSLLPIVLPPLHCISYIDFLPEMGSITNEADKKVIDNLVEKLKPYLKVYAIGYEGEVDDRGFKSGRGICNYENGDIFTGNFLKDLRHGSGVMRYADGTLYEGEFTRDKRDCYGVCKFLNGDVYSGDFKNDFLQGTGRFDHYNGDVYEGQFKQNEKQGIGVYVSANGDVYRGQFIKSLRYGHGVLMSNSKSKVIYQGEFKFDELDGVGILKYRDGSFYLGRFVKGERCGLGTYVVPGDGLYDDRSSYVQSRFYTGHTEVHQEGLVMSIEGSLLCFHIVHKPHMFCIHIESEMSSFGCTCCFRCLGATFCYDSRTCLYSMCFSLPLACIPQLCCVQPGYIICDNKFEYPSKVCWRNLTHLLLPSLFFPALCFRYCCLKPWGSYDTVHTGYFSSKIVPGIEVE